LARLGTRQLDRFVVLDLDVVLTGRLIRQLKTQVTEALARLDLPLLEDRCCRYRPISRLVHGTA